MLVLIVLYKWDASKAKAKKKTVKTVNETDESSDCALCSVTGEQIFILHLPMLFLLVFISFNVSVIFESKILFPLFFEPAKDRENEKKEVIFMLITTNACV